MEPTADSRQVSRWNATPVPERVAERAYERAERREDGCWISRYSTASHGYAQVGWQESGDRHVVLAHRAAWTRINGQVPLGMTLDHTCKQRRCVNPAHLRLLPNYENARRTSGRDWPMGYCANGHPNSALVPRSKDAPHLRICGECRREATRRYYNKYPEKRAQAVARRREQRRAAGPTRRAPKEKAEPKERRPRALNSHCKYGHPMSGDNLSIKANGSRRCLACHRREMQAARARKAND